MFNEYKKGYRVIVYGPGQKLDNNGKCKFYKNKPAIIVELKRNTSVQSAIDQIRQKEYPDILKKYKDNFLLVGVSYSEKSKKHSAIIEKA